LSSKLSPYTFTVCINVLEQVDASLAPADKKNKDKIEAAIEKFCSQKLSAKDDKMCYYLKPIKKHISQPFSLGMPKLK
jgi:mesencephalic astrocyte-derived neurotrophic factor